jgi:lipopolysaccharide/colanic/teichoic acid biosynthesis glycosyltransferase
MQRLGQLEPESSPRERAVLSDSGSNLYWDARGDRESSRSARLENETSRRVAPDTLPARVVRRLVDVAVAVTMLALTAPVMVLLAIWIRRDSPGPALFWQVRMGKDRREGRAPGAAPTVERRKTDMAGRPMRFVKFRTMYVDARERNPELYRYQYSPAQMETLVFKCTDDPRVTPVGRWLRRTSLDELPNFINLLLGQVTLVGPRPEIPEMTPYYSEEARAKFAVKPGITGAAQISGRALLTWKETVQLDVEYVANRSLRRDLEIVVGTLKAALTGRGAF